MKKIVIPFIVGLFLLACNNKSITVKKTTPEMTFKKADWIHNTDVYEVNLRQYTKEGTFNAFGKELPRLKAMGVSTLWFMPITPISKKEMKGSMGSYYACSDYTAINPEFGTMDDFKSLVKQAHSMGFKVIIDWVANHTGWDHVWTKSHPEYYEMDSATNDFKRASGMDDIIELNFNNKDLRKAMIDAMQFWVKECDIDGYRCDLAFWVELDFWLEARAALEKTKTLFWLAENDGIDNPHYYQAFDACYTWKWMHDTEEFYKGKINKRSLDTLLNRYNSIGGSDAIKLWFTTNHDENSWNGTEYEKYGDAAKALAVFSFTWDGIPLIYSGQELPNKKRLDFFDKDVIAWTGKYELEDFYKTLLQLRKRNKSLETGNIAATTHVLFTTDNDNVLAYLRKNGSQEVLVLLNLSNHKVDFTVSDAQLSGSFNDVFHNLDFTFNKDQHFAMQPWQYLVYEKK
ncbi:MAG: alpha-amylase family glycosyl hydrolase [Bacteroidota bacterium]